MMTTRTKEEALCDEYRIRFEKIQQYRNDVWKIICRRFLREVIPKEAHVLDLGCGWGEFIKNIRAGKKYAMDLNPDSGVHLHGSVVFLQQDCSKECRLPDESPDVVFKSNFLEHLP
ncbi:MAG: class I SAM-dependent methyltransferase, partial [Desulfobacteraceae bacterium]